MLTNLFMRLRWLLVLRVAWTALATPAVAHARQALPSFAPGDSLGGRGYNCADFRSQAQAQAVLRAAPTDPNRLDGNRDGVACEDYPQPPFSTYPVHR